MRPRERSKRDNSPERRTTVGRYLAARLVVFYGRPNLPDWRAVGRHAHRQARSSCPRGGRKGCLAENLGIWMRANSRTCSWPEPHIISRQVSECRSRSLSVTAQGCPRLAAVLSMCISSEVKLNFCCGHKTFTWSDFHSDALLAVVVAVESAGTSKENERPTDDAIN